MNAERFLCAASLILLGASSAWADGTLETNFRTHGPKMHQLVGELPVKDALQKSSALIQRGLEKIAYGVVVSPDGYILTKASEVPEGSTLSVTVDDKIYTTVKFAGSDPKWDVVLLKIEATDLIPVRYATGPEPDRGTWVVANGVTTRKERSPQIGVISANARESKPQDGMILGAAFDDHEGQIAISDLADNGEAKKAGLEVGDVILGITSVEDHPITDYRTMASALEGHPIGSTVVLIVKREDKTLNVTVPLGEMLTRNDAMSGENRSARRSGFPRVIQHDIIADVARMGGPVFDLDGNCVGMNIARANRCETYAIPALELKGLAEEMIAKAK